MDELKELRWKQRFSNFEKAFRLLNQYIRKPLETDLERAGIIQLFEVAFELSWKVMKDYLEAEELRVNSPREVIKTAFHIGLIENGHVWIDALTDRNLTVHTYDEAVAKKMVQEIAESYFLELEKLYERLKKEL